MAVASIEAAPPFDYETFLKSVRVPPDFEIKLASGQPLVRFPMFACIDDATVVHITEPVATLIGDVQALVTSRTLSAAHGNPFSSLALIIKCWLVAIVI